MIISWWYKDEPRTLRLLKDENPPSKMVGKRKAVPYEIEMYNRGIRIYTVSKLKDGLEFENFTRNITRKVRSVGIETERMLELLKMAGRPVKTKELYVAYWRKYRQERTWRQIQNRLNQMTMHGETRIENIPGKGWQIKK